MKMSKSRRLLALILGFAAAFSVAAQAHASPSPASSRPSAHSMAAPLTADSYYPTCSVDARDTAPQLIQEPTGDVWVIRPETVFFPGDYCQIGKSKLTMQMDGNFALYDENGHPRWANNEVGGGTRWTTFQKDGNLVEYLGNPYLTFVWASNTCCHSDYFLAVQEDGNVVIYDGGWHAHWATNTRH
jgi:hypothetical protein